MSDEMPTAHEYIVQLLPADIIFKCDTVKEKIVRCRDCIYYDTVHLDCARQGWSDCERDGFCSWGERKEENA
ncbi:MAG: hypothetical protein K6F24_05310 [Atopobiaceae bacterium]|nr:hypothetical protein [Atopobiaceae bacterium]